jgi:transcription initiation factor IIE alpha subunit
MHVLMPMDLEEYSKEKLWQLLVEAVHASVMYPTHKAYTRASILPQKPEVTANELAERLGMPLGEALVILSELVEEKKFPV